MPKSIIIKKNGGPEVLELQEVEVGSPGPDEIKVINNKNKTTLYIKALSPLIFNV